MMSFNEHLGEPEEFRVVLVLRWSRMVLVEHHDHNYRLPHISVPKWTRVAERLAEELQARWAIRTIVVDLLPQTEDLLPIAIVEVLSRDWRATIAGCVPVRVDDLDEHELSMIERLMVNNVVAGNTQGRGPFSKVGWIEVAQDWIRDSVLDRVVEFSEDVRRLNASGSFALVRFGTLRGPAYWLKATGVPNVHEFQVTQTLSRYWPEFLPPFVAARTDWNAWVTEEVGRPLQHCSSLHSFEQAAHGLAGLQYASATHVETLLVSGCFDQRMSILRSHIPGLIQYLEDAMARQTSTKIAPLTPIELHQLGRLLEAASAAMETIGIPNTLIHNDMNPGNILFDGVRAVFTDWSEAGVGNPFFTFQHLLVQAAGGDQTRAWAQRVKEIYKQQWRYVLSEPQIDRAFALCPPLAIASYLCGRDPSFTCSKRRTDQARSYARSLTRHLSRFAKAPEFLEALWP